MEKMIKYKKIIGIVLIMVLLGMFITTIKPSAVETPSKTEITYCVSSDEGRLLLNWTLKNVDGYELNLAQNETFNRNPQTLIYNGDSRKASLTSLAPGITYYVRVRTFNMINGEKVYSDWSAISTINIHKHYYTRTISQYPTCNQNGIYSYKCNCGRYFKMPINKFGHNYELVSDTNSDKCGEYKCTRCGDVKNSVEHNYKLTKTVTATCQEDGYKEYTCQNCGDVKTEKTSDKLSHDYRKVNETNTEITYQCVYCHDTYTETIKNETVETKPTENKTENDTEDKEYVVDLGNGKTTTLVGHYDRKMAEEIFEQLNDYRTSIGMPTLANASSKLQEAADIRSYEIANTFEHYRPNGERALISFRDTTSCCAENIAKYQKSATEVMTDWKNSVGHNSNMISKYPKSVAVSVFAEKYLNKYGDVKYRYHFVQFFGW